MNYRKPRLAVATPTSLLGWLKGMLVVRTPRTTTPQGYARSLENHSD